MSEIIAADIGGTHARFAIAGIDAGQIVSLGSPVILKTADYCSLEAAWETFARQMERPLPRAAGIAAAGSVRDGVLKFTNNAWKMPLASLPARLGIDCYELVNDFGAVGHAVAQLEAGQFRHLFGPEQPLPVEGVTSIIGPGTGLGVAQLVRRAGHYHVIETEGGHIDFAPLDDTEDRILAHLRGRYGRVSVERVVSGPGLANIYEGLAANEHRRVRPVEDKALWAAAMSGEDGVAVAAVDHFCLMLGSIAGDVALAQGARAVVIAGGLGLRLADHLARSGFHGRFIAKGRFAGRMEEMPIKLLTHAEPGLFGAAAAFGCRHLS